MLKPDKHVVKYLDGHKIRIIRRNLSYEQVWCPIEGDTAAEVIWFRINHGGLLLSFEFFTNAITPITVSPNLICLMLVLGISHF